MLLLSRTNNIEKVGMLKKKQMQKITKKTGNKLVAGPHN